MDQGERDPTSSVLTADLRFFLSRRRHSGATQSRKASARRRIKGKSFAVRFVSTTTIVWKPGGSRCCERTSTRVRTRGEKSLTGENELDARRNAKEVESCWIRSG